MREPEIREWCFFLGAKNTQEASAELHRLITRLDEALDIVNYVVKLLAGSPGGFAEETLVVSRGTLAEALENLADVWGCIASTGPEAA